MKYMRQKLEVYLLRCDLACWEKHSRTKAAFR